MSTLDYWLYDATIENAIDVLTQWLHWLASNVQDGFVATYLCKCIVDGR